ncbi:hypothetical protein [Liquorilactobacillus capillatus]|uniref:Uncharacterized protein n=1 Tax=Liquorilactobacillus capillatus DSM 19910 TaxID=1423731 RepID=A0A0R1M621_9LACO|nr:hypothetical protein [Liquorilactobacillus capillatus]KRL03297.1 hypothetical protein FC81_GL000021 [Liquorilactobacillus capillatus DSM 19910]
MIKINKKEVSEEYLVQKASTLTGLQQELKVAVDYLSVINYLAVNKDSFATSYFIENGSLNNLIDSLENLDKALEQLSCDLCPDM